MREFNSLVKEICKKNKIKFNLLSDDWIMVLEKDKKIKFCTGYKLDLNGAGISKLLDDKFGLFTVLNIKHIKVINHIIIFKGYDRDYVLDYFNNCDKDIVVKDNNGSCGYGVYHVKDKKDLFDKIDLVLSTNYSVSLCPFYDIKTEYRLINVDGNIELVYGKKRPIVIGDGSKSIIELLREFNPLYFNKVNDDKLNRVLDKGEVYEYGWQFNLSQGSMPFYIEDESLIKRLMIFANEVINAIDIKYCSIDIIELKSGELLLMECNSGIMMENFIRIMPDGREKAYSIYEKAILALFK